MAKSGRAAVGRCGLESVRRLAAPLMHASYQDPRLCRDETERQQADEVRARLNEREKKQNRPKHKDLKNHVGMS